MPVIVPAMTGTPPGSKASDAVTAAASTSDCVAMQVTRQACRTGLHPGTHLQRVAVAAEADGAEVRVQQP